MFLNLIGVTEVFNVSKIMTLTRFGFALLFQLLLEGRYVLLLGFLDIQTCLDLHIVK